MKSKTITKVLFVSIFPVLILIALSVFAAQNAGAETSSSCDIQRGPCMRINGDGIKVEFDIKPRPVSAMSELTFIVILTKNGKPLRDASVGLDLSMPGMFMGANRPVLHLISAGRYEGKGIITRCMSGRKTWQARVTVEHAGKTAAVDFVFEVQ